MRNSIGGPPFYGQNEKGIKRGRSPPPQSEYYKHAGQQQGVYMPPKTPDTGRHETRRAVLWYNPAKYGQAPQWPMTNRYPLPQNVPAPPHILHLNSEHQQPPQSQPAPQKTGSIEISKIVDPMRPKIPGQQQDFTIHRRIGNVNQPGQQPEFPNPPYHANILRYE